MDYSNEFLDVVDDEDNIVGKASRKECHDKRLTHRTVMFFIFDKAGGILVNKRAADKEFFGGLWSIVLGGHVGAGQTYDDAAVREAYEEAGVKSNPFVMGDFKKRIPQECENVRVYGFMTSDKPNLLKDEIECGEFMKINEVEKKVAQEEFIPETTQLMKILKRNLSENKLLTIT